jgi:hypothetical protein
MESKKLIWIFMTIGLTVGGSIPLLWGAGELSFSSLILSALGGLIGIYIGFRLSQGY